MMASNHYIFNQFALEVEFRISKTACDNRSHRN
jgi:hypothetical protein